MPTTGALKWGTGGPTTASSTSNLVSPPAPSQAGSTYNITNNNNINYNYGSNITAISSEGAGSVPTFHDLEKAKKEAEAKNASYTSSTLGYLGSAVGTVASGIGGSKGISSVTQSLQTSKGLAQVSDTIKRNTGLDIHKALGGKTAVQLAEERLKKEQDSAQAGYGGGYGYQGISIPLTPALGTGGEANKEAATSNSGYEGPGEKLNVASASKYNQQWGAKQEEAPKIVNTQKLFQGVGPQKKRLDDDSDEEDEKPKKVHKPEKTEKEEPKKEEVDLLDMNT